MELETNDKTIVATLGTGFPLYNILYCAGNNGGNASEFIARFSYELDGINITSLPSSIYGVGIEKINRQIIYTYYGTDLLSNDISFGSGYPVVFRENIVDGQGGTLVANTVYFACDTQSRSTPTTRAPFDIKLNGTKRQLKFFVKLNPFSDDFVL
jgi:hypothetical protein